VGDVSDYPCIGIAPNHFVQTNKVSDKTGSFKHWRVVIRDADAMTAGQPGGKVNGWEWWGWYNPDNSPAYIIQPAVHHGSSPGIFLVNKWNNHAEVWAIHQPLVAGQQSVSVADVPLPGSSGSLINAPQKGNKVASPPPIAMGPQIGDAFLKAVYRAGKLYFTANNAQLWGGNGPFASGRLLRANVVLFPGVGIEIDRTFGSASSSDPAGQQFHYAWPAIEVNKHGDMVLCTTRTSAAYNYYGETTAACVDPTDDTAVWVAAQYPFATTNPKIANWSMWVAKL
jgi:hypothetical protein